jgi:hypothetical protein
MVFQDDENPGRFMNILSRKGGFRASLVFVQSVVSLCSGMIRSTNSVELLHKGP